MRNKYYLQWEKSLRITELLGNKGSFLAFAVDLLHKSIDDFVELGYFCTPAYVHIGKSYKCSRMIVTISSFE